MCGEDKFVPLLHVRQVLGNSQDTTTHSNSEENASHSTLLRGDAIGLMLTFDDVLKHAQVAK